MAFLGAKELAVATFFAFLTGCAAQQPSTRAPQSGITADAEQTAHSRQILEHRHWRFTLKNGHMQEFTGIAVVKPHGSQRILEMRMPDKEQVIDLSDVASAKQLSDRVASGVRNASLVHSLTCDDPDVCPGGDPIPSDSGCDPTVSFCCPQRNAFGTTIACGDLPSIPEGAGCEFNDLCGDDGMGNRVGVAFLPFAGRYCWYDFQTFDSSCFLKAIPFFSHGDNLFRSWHLDPPNVAVLLCNPPSADGWGFANYEDRGVTPTHTGFEVKHVLGKDTVPGSIVSWTYPNDFLFGRFDMTSQATLESRYYRTTIPLNFFGNQLGFCNSDGKLY